MKYTIVISSKYTIEAKNKIIAETIVLEDIRVATDNMEETGEKLKDIFDVAEITKIKKT